MNDTANHQFADETPETDGTNLSDEALDRALGKGWVCCNCGKNFTGCAGPETFGPARVR